MELKTLFDYQEHQSSAYVCSQEEQFKQLVDKFGSNLCNVKSVNEKNQLICCESCEKWVCLGCSDLSRSQYVLLCSSVTCNNTFIHWYCKNCNEAAIKAVKSDIVNVITINY